MDRTSSFLPKWILIVSGLFAVMEIMVSLAMWLSPETVVESVDLEAKGVGYLISMWAARQLALGVIFAFAAIKRSAQMLTITYLFFLVMFAGDLVTGLLERENSLVISAIVMCCISIGMLVAINRQRQ